MSEKLTFIDLFAGAGGLSEGFIRAGYDPVAHVEIDKAACNTLTTRTAFHYLKDTGGFKTYKEYLRGAVSRDDLYRDIPKELQASVLNYAIGPENNAAIFSTIDRLIYDKGIQNQVDLIIGGPPCQAYSLVGRARSENGMKKDPRNYLYKQYTTFLEKYRPKMFVFENVIGLKSAKNGAYLRDMERLFFQKGYKMQLFTLEANRFNVLQKRRRVIIIGWRGDFAPTLPDLEGMNLYTGNKVASVFDDLPPLNAGDGVDKYQRYAGGANSYLSAAGIRNGIKELTQHIARPHTRQDKDIYRIAVEQWNNEGKRLDYNDLPAGLKSHNNRASFVDRFKVVADNLNYSQTIVAHISKDGHYYIHPDIEQNRSISVREAARLQSFPDDFYFEGIKQEGSRTAAFKQIGNAVPPVMAFKIAEEINKVLCQK
ncbi:MAG: DNA cytosine methyltransferase [Niabella sp.]|nr:DNA cytosine methyltransferase [Niabella sp.]